MITTSNIDALTAIGPITPLAREVEGRLREWILAANYESGDQLPSEREICEELKVNRRVVRSAIKLLERDGVLICRPNCRPIIAGAPATAVREPVHEHVTKPPSQELSNFVALMMWHGDHREQGNSGQQRIFWGLNRTLNNAGYHTVFLDLGEPIAGEPGDAGQEAAYLKYALDREFGGIVFYCCSEDANRELLQRVTREVPFVMIDRQVYGVEADYVGVTNFNGTYEATKYLQDLGHKRIAHVTVSIPVSAVERRLRGYLQAVEEAEHGYEVVLPVPRRGGDFWPAAEAIFKLPPGERPTAVVCVNDFEARTIYNLLNRLGLDVPGDVSIIGFDNLVSHLPNGVGLTTVAQPYEEIGEQAARLILQQVNSRNSVRMHVECPTELIRRDSCKPPSG